jgi:hypothetical protein
MDGRTQFHLKRFPPNLPLTCTFTVLKGEWGTCVERFSARKGQAMKCSKLVVGLLFASVLVGGAANAQTISGEVTISFGEMVIGGAGTATVSTTANTRSSTGSVALVGTALVSRGSINITHTPGAQVVINFPASIAMTGASSPVLAPAILGGTTQTIPAGGVLTVFFGGTISFTTGGVSGPADCLVPVEVLPL